MKHELKTWPKYFQLIADGTKSFELRKNDRDFQQGQVLILREFDEQTNTYTGRTLHRKITYVLQGEEAGVFGLKEGFCIMGLEII